MRTKAIVVGVALFALAGAGAAQASSKHHGKHHKHHHASKHHRRKHASGKCTGPVACIPAKGAQLKINRVQSWAPTGTAPNGDALIAVWVGVYDTTGPSNYPQNPGHGILDPNPDADAFNGSYYVVDSTGATNAEYSNGCRYQSGDPSNPYLEPNYGPPKNKLLYPHQHEANVALCFAVKNPQQRMKFVWHPNHDHNLAYSISIPAARSYSGQPTPNP